MASTENARHAFHDRGFAVFSRLFAAEEMWRLAEVARRTAGEAYAILARHPRLLAAIEEFPGAPHIAGALAFDLAETRSWLGGDVAESRRLMAAILLADLEPHEGGLLVVPGSHDGAIGKTGWQGLVCEIVAGPAGTVVVLDRRLDVRETRAHNLARLPIAYVGFASAGIRPAPAASADDCLWPNAYAWTAG
jgi:hypothetical protein